MPPKLPEEYSDFRKDQILNAAWDCFVEKGYSETTMREISKRIKSSTGVIYNAIQGDFRSYR
jgi:AcrR family transcriptional regulator